MPLFNASTMIHNALWSAFEHQRNEELRLGSQTYPITYQDTPRAHRARAVIKDVVWESQNMRKASANTRKIQDNPQLRISWAFKHGAKTRWLEKVESVDQGERRVVACHDLQHQPNRVTHRASFLHRNS